MGLGEWLTFLRALEMGLHRASLRGFYNVGRAVLCSSEADFDVFDQVFLEVFGSVAAEAVELTDQLREWLADPAHWPDLPPELIHALEDLDLEELRRLFEERLAEQDSRHDGGDRWIGTAGRSPFGWAGRRRGGIRVSGQSVWQSALQVAASRHYEPYRRDLILDVRQIQVALRKLRELAREGREEELDIQATVDATCRNAGELELRFVPKRRNRVKVLLLMDVGGSMTPHARLVSRLFTAASRSSHFKDLQYYYFHNCVYENLYRDAGWREAVALSDVLAACSRDYKLILVGDARMHPVELFRPGGAIHYWDWNPKPGIAYLEALAGHFDRAVWLNPTPRSRWRHPTVSAIGQVFPMLPLSLDGLEEAVRILVGGRSFTRPVAERN